MLVFMQKTKKIIFKGHYYIFPQGRVYDLDEDLGRIVIQKDVAREIIKPLLKIHVPVKGAAVQSNTKPEFVIGNNTIIRSKKKKKVKIK